MKCDSNPMDIYTLDGLLCGHSLLHITAPPADKWLLFLTIQEMLSIYKQSLSELRVLLLLFYCFLAKGYTMDINLYKVKIMQHKKSICCVQNLIHNIKKKGGKERSFVCNMLAVVFIE